MSLRIVDADLHKGAEANLLRLQLDDGDSTLHIAVLIQDEEILNLPTLKEKIELLGDL